MPEHTFLNDPYIRTSAVLDLIRRVLRRLLVVTGVLAVLGIGIGLLVAGVPGVWAALIAAALGLFFTGTTVLGLYLVAGRGPELLQVVILGGFIAKMAVLAVVLLWLRGQDFYDRGVFIATIIGLVLATLVVEMYTVASSRIPYVEPPTTTSEAEAPDGLTEHGADHAQDGESAPPGHHHAP